MRFGWMAIFGLALACTAPAEAAGNNQSGARTQDARPSTRAALPPGVTPRVNAVNGRGHAVQGRTAARNPMSRQLAPYHRAAAPSAQVRDRSGQLVMAPGFHRTVLRGQTAAAACHTSRGRRVCGGARQVSMRWTGGLPPAAGNQSTCPDGTMATLALGHDNVVRCVPL